MRQQYIEQTKGFSMSDSSNARKWGVPFAVVGGITLLIVLALSLLPKSKPIPRPVIPQDFAVVGTLTLRGSSGIGHLNGIVNATPGSVCFGQRGYDDIDIDSQVTISADGRVVAVGNLEGGTYDGTGCVFTFRVAQVPANHAMYAVEVAHRGAAHFPASVIQTEPVRLTIG
jgi:hypothetical protein